MHHSTVSVTVGCRRAWAETYIARVVGARVPAGRATVVWVFLVGRVRTPVVVAAARVLPEGVQQVEVVADLRGETTKTIKLKNVAALAFLTCAVSTWLLATTCLAVGLNLRGRGGRPSTQPAGIAPLFHERANVYMCGEVPDLVHQGVSEVAALHPTARGRAGVHGHHGLQPAFTRLDRQVRPPEVPASGHAHHTPR